MRTVGIICEYDPLHLGHQKQLDTIRRADPSSAIVCLMSGNYVQRGKPAIMDKALRAAAAVASGADLVLELPLTATLSSAEGFAAKGVAILGSFCDKLCFGAEDADPGALMATAQALLSDAFPPALRIHLDQGLSFPAARSAALTDLGLSGELLSKPNDILAVEYCKAIIAQNCAMAPMPIHRGGGYHDQAPHATEPSATALRPMLLEGQDWRPYVPAAAVPFFEDAVLHALSAGERAILGKLRTMTEAEFEALPYGSEGLWRKLMHAARSCATLEEVAAAVKSKRYARTRIDRMILCAFLGLTQADLDAQPPYARVLAFNDTGRQILNAAREYILLPNVGEKLDHPYQAMEDRAEALCGLFAVDAPQRPDPKHRIYYHK